MIHDERCREANGDGQWQPKRATPAVSGCSTCIVVLSLLSCTVVKKKIVVVTHLTQCD